MCLCVFVGMCGRAVQGMNVCSGYLNSDENKQTDTHAEDVEEINLFFLNLDNFMLKKR